MCPYLHLAILACYINSNSLIEHLTFSKSTIAMKKKKSVSQYSYHSIPYFIMVCSIMVFQVTYTSLPGTRRLCQWYTVGTLCQSPALSLCVFFFLKLMIMYFPFSYLESHFLVMILRIAVKLSESICVLVI